METLAAFFFFNYSEMEKKKSRNNNCFRKYLLTISLNNGTLRTFRSDVGDDLVAESSEEAFFQTGESERRGARSAGRLLMDGCRRG